MSLDKIKTELSNFSAFENQFEDFNTLQDCRFLQPNSIIDQIKRLLIPFGYKRVDITYKKYNKILNYLTNKGILNSIKNSEIQYNDNPPAHKVRLQYSETIYGYGAEYGKVTGSAFAVALGELLERYFTSDANNVKNSFLLRIQKMFLTKISLEKFNSYTSEQSEIFPELKRREADKYSYTVCKRYSTNKKILIPTQLISWGGKDSNEGTLIHQTTSGCGGFYNKETAILSGLHELVQRDAFLIMWLTKTIKKQIDINSIPKESSAYNLVQKVLSRGMQMHFILMNNDIDIQSITCLLVDERDEEAVVGLGACSGYNLDTCLNSSLVEALSILNYNTSNSIFFDIKNYKSFITKGIGRKARLTLWKGEIIRNLSFLRSGEAVPYVECLKNNKTFTTKKEELTHIIQTLESKGEDYYVYVYQIKSRLLGMLGYNVVKVVVPALFPLYLDEIKATLSSKRLADALGVTQSSIKFSNLNPLPHLFP